MDEIEALGVPGARGRRAGRRLARSGGRRAGALGTAATFSFFPSKNLGAFGDGGAVTTDDDAVAERVRMLRFHGSRDKQTFELVGHNSRLDELQAAILRVQLPHLDAWADGRRAAAAHYEAAGLGELVGLPARSTGAEPAWHLYVVRHERADELAAALKAAGIGQQGLLPRAGPRAAGDARRIAPARRAARHRAEAARTHLAIPMSPVLSREQADEVVGRGARCGSGSTSLTRRTCWSCARSSGRSSERGAEVLRHGARLRADARAVERHGLDDEAIGRHRGGRLAAKGVGLLSRSAALARWARGRQDRRRARPRLQRRHGRRRGCSASRARPRSTTSGRRSSTPSTAGSCKAIVVPDAIPPERLAPYGATPRKLRPYAGLKEEYYLADFEPDRAVLGELGLDPAQPIAVVRTPPAVSLYHRFENPLFARVLDRAARRCRPSCSRARPSSAPSWRRLHRPRAGDRRAVADGLRRPRDLRRRHDEPRGGRARHAGVDDVRGPARRGRRGADRRRAACAGSSARRTSHWKSERHPAASGSAATRPCWPICCCPRSAAWRLPAAREPDASRPRQP